MNMKPVFKKFFDGGQKWNDHKNLKGQANIIEHPPPNNHGVRRCLERGGGEGKAGMVWHREEAIPCIQRGMT